MPYSSSPTGAPSEAGTLRPLPRPTRLSQPFWDACREGRLLYQKDGVTGQPIFPPQAFSPSAIAVPPVWAESAGKGSVYSFTVIWRPQTPAFEVPYVAAIVELDEGYTMITNIVDCDPGELETGKRVRVDFRPVRDGFVLPFFVLDPTA